MAYNGIIYRRYLFVISVLEWDAIASVWGLAMVHVHIVLLNFKVVLHVAK